MPGTHDRERRPYDDRARGFAIPDRDDHEDPDGGDLSGLWGRDTDGSRVRVPDLRSPDEIAALERMKGVQRPPVPAPPSAPGRSAGPVR